MPFELPFAPPFLPPESDCAALAPEGSGGTFWLLPFRLGGLGLISSGSALPGSGASGAGVARTVSSIMSTAVLERPLVFVTVRGPGG